MLLLDWFNHLLGYKSNRELLADTKMVAEGFGPEGRSYFYHHLEARGDKLKLSLTDLARYDENIREHLRAMNARRSDPITLRYFQYLAALYCEIFLERCFRGRRRLIQALDEFVRERNARKNPGEPQDSGFAEEDLGKVAVWMATGSGKTLLMHLNYRQFLHYNDRPLDNILLITPNEGLSDQHMEEMAASGILSERFDLEESGLTLTAPNVVRVIEITKLVEEKRGGGQSVPVEAFEGNNLIFVDEGHKGSGGAVWRGFRDALSATGFTFEYSATFGQALTAARNDELTKEYGRAIIFDYSYRYFHGDGYGKDFHILNLKQETREEATETLFLGNLLSFYEQQRIFHEKADQIRPYNLEKPLWVFVGSSVNAVYTERGRKRSDVLTVVRFLHHLLENKDGWVIKTIRDLLDGRSGLVDPHGQDIFEERFGYLRSLGVQPEKVYRDILARVLHTPTGGALQIADMRGSPGELGLKASGAENYFGVIYIGDTSSFKKLVEGEGSGIAIEEDAVTDSLFKEINAPNTTVEILIGAKKFMEGWNSWRVSSMGLLNIGRREGSEIIQLFGRGVRLRGRDSSLKRSAVLDGEHPAHLGVLETLTIFAVRANYMAQFRDYLEKEGVETEGATEIPLPIRENARFLKEALMVPRVPKDRSFSDEVNLLLEVDCDVRVHVDMSLKVEAFESDLDGLKETAAKAGKEQRISKQSLELIDWEEAYLDLIEYKERKGLRNLVVRPRMIREIVETDEPSRVYALVAAESVVNPRSFGERKFLQEAVTSILRKYAEKFYRVRQERWESLNMVYGVLDESDGNFQDYVIKIPRGEAELVTAVHQLIEEGKRIYNAELRELPNIYFDRHLYQPLLVERGEKIRSTPPGLNESEEGFVADLREYFREQKEGLLAQKEIFLLRNLTRSKGIGFFDKSRFYPDFILWVQDGARQRIVFIEPHGMIHAKAYDHDEKAQLHVRLRELAVEMGERSDRDDLELDSFLISATPYEELRMRYDDGSWDRKRFAKAHILFPERNGGYDYITNILGSSEV
ncbi:MAG: DEAD/DEAH box helicase family protein [Gemmatimonadota bacterium]